MQQNQSLSICNFLNSKTPSLLFIDPYKITKMISLVFHKKLFLNQNIQMKETYLVL